MNHLKAENSIDRGTQPEKREIQPVIAGEPSGKNDGKIRNLNDEEQEEDWKLFVQLTSP